MSKLTQTLLELDEEWMTRLMTRVRGLTDDEHFWEPVRGCWSVRRRQDGTWAAEWGRRNGQDPLATIAARLWHIGARPWPVPPATSAREAVRRHFVEKYAPEGGSDQDACGSAAEAIESLEEQWRERRAVFGRATEDELLTPLGADAHRYADACWFDLQIHFLDERIHHSAEVALMRDFYAAIPSVREASSPVR